MKKRKSTIKDLEKRVKKLEMLAQEITIKINQSYKRPPFYFTAPSRPPSIPGKILISGKIPPGIPGKFRMSSSKRRKF